MREGGRGIGSGMGRLRKGEPGGGIEIWGEWEWNNNNKR